MIEQSHFTSRTSGKRSSALPTHSALPCRSARSIAAEERAAAEGEELAVVRQRPHRHRRGRASRDVAEPAQSSPAAAAPPPVRTRPCPMPLPAVELGHAARRHRDRPRRRTRGPSTACTGSADSGSRAIASRSQPRRPPACARTAGSCPDRCANASWYMHRRQVQARART